MEASTGVSVGQAEGLGLIQHCFGFAVSIAGCGEPAEHKQKSGNVKGKATATSFGFGSEELRKAPGCKPSQSFCLGFPSETSGMC